MTYPEMVAKLIKTDHEIWYKITTKQCGLMHAILGISGEAGELVDAVKKHIVYQKELDRDNMIEELGDMEFYLENLRTQLNVTREECLDKNMKKLAKRYKNFDYTDTSAIERADKIVNENNPIDDGPHPGEHDVVQDAIEEHIHGNCYEKNPFD